MHISVQQTNIHEDNVSDGLLYNLKDYADYEEYVELMKFFQNKKIPLLMIERHQHEELDDISHLTIIDKDLCVL